jgi:hypothetical protein
MTSGDDYGLVWGEEGEICMGNEAARTFFRPHCCCAWRRTREASAAWCGAAERAITSEGAEAVWLPHSVT